MATTMVNIRMDKQTKTDMETVCKELGMSMTTAFTIFAKKMGREHRIPFEVSVDPFYSEENLAHIRRGAKALDEGHGITHDLVDEHE
ncbi:MAG: type II toxin-antitoxin system RelB/DinJ family antitoxin [Eggerthellaceae bacterium]|jgi:DNA-damage-inducible protein J